ncbi:hypothetical protein Calag_0949 [Caldisphaera lagunensis DSM 15908]|uniref:AP superfamily protein n=1 Tax=Caldisphaera lagunensis (strain DSM 15908 / JCM 11604 / ANMR 0165 / IC-154) TaxID=1056495 RepID=L0AC27_CALLD|nr:alkaline phosphatase family protein [Caldisphaera lagunensis]AFZ70677.1 hypothetical protein Calag_0949 [Caldisphaera lagunensis DSM 15908]
MKVLVLGLDGLSPQILKNALKKVDLPNLEKIIKKGETHSLLSIPPVTPIEWTSIATGVNPAKHGIWGFTKLIKIIDERKDANEKSYKKITAKWRYYTSKDVRFPRFFEISSFKRKNTLVINYPLTWPIEGNWNTANSDIISDTLISPRVETNRDDLKKFLKYFDPGLNPYDKTISYIKGFEKIIEEKSYELYTIILPFPDQAFHKDPDEVLNIRKRSRNIWEEIDSLLAFFLNFDNIFIVSDHGLAAYRKYANPLVPILYGNGYEKNMFTIAYTIVDKLSLYLKIPFRLIIKKTLIRKYFNFLRYRNELYKLNQIEAFTGYESEIEKIGFSHDMHDPADVWTTYFLNDEIRDEIIKIIKNDEVSKYVDIKKCEELFNGIYFPDFPSALFIPKFFNDTYLDFSRYPFSLSRLRLDLRTNHHIYGTFIAYGRGIKEKGKINLSSPLTNYDVSPTVLSSLGLQIPRGIDGKGIIEPIGNPFPYDIAMRIKKI